MTLSRLTPALALAGLLVATTGCGGPKSVPVSGVVTVDGKPYKRAVVSFQPLAGPGNPAPGRGSSGLTDENGRFSLMGDDGAAGALPGRHRVRIQTEREGAMVFVDPTVCSPDGGLPQAKKGPVDPIPAEWHSDKGMKEFDVPAGGTDAADFAISSSPAGGGQK